MKSKGQNRGHCQACGRIHVVLPSGNLAKHGYAVAGFGYFKGVCQGANHKPLERERYHADAIIRALEERAQLFAQIAVELENGQREPLKAQKVEHGVRQYVRVGREREPLLVEWSNASVQEKRMQVEHDAGLAESEARHASSHAASMSRLADRVHGQPLIDRDAEELAKVAERKAKSAPIENAYRSQAAKSRDLEQLNRQYSKLNGAFHAAGVNYMDLPMDLHNFNQRRLSALLAKYPDAKDLLLQAAALYAARELVKSRPVIK